MKKHLLSVAAIVLAVAFSAFTSANNKSGNAKDADPYFWYAVDGTQSYTVGTTVNASQRELKSVYAVDDCQDDMGEPICLVGFSDEVSSPYPVPTNPDQIIRETENP